MGVIKKLLPDINQKQIQCKKIFPELIHFSEIMKAFGFLTFIFCWVSISAAIDSAVGHSTCKGYDCFKEYVDKKDSVYEWSDTGHRLHGLDPLHLKSWTGYVLNFTSQQWLTPEDSSRSI